MNTKNFVDKVHQMLTASFVDENGEEKHYYQGPIAGMFVDQQYNHIKSFLEESAKKKSSLKMMRGIFCQQNRPLDASMD